MEILAGDIDRTPGGGTWVESRVLRPCFTGRLFVLGVVFTAPLARSLVRRSLKDRKNNESQAKQAGKGHQCRNEPKVHDKVAQYRTRREKYKV